MSSMSNKATLRMRRYLTMGILCITAALGQADELIDARGLPYTGSVTKYRDRTLHFRAANIRREKTCTLDQIRSLKIEGLDAFNQAESLAAKKQYAEAIEAYDKAFRSVPKDRDWVKALIADRRYQACAKGGKIDEAMKQWLAMMDADPDDKVSRALMPETFAPKGDPTNAAALKLLNEKIIALKDDPKTEAYTRRLLKLKMELLEAMGEEEKATAAAEAVTRLGDKSSATNTGEATPPPVTSDLDVLRRLMESGKYDEVIEKLAPRMKTLPKRDLTGPLFLLAKTQWRKYQADEPKDRKLLLRAGLNLMWVYSAYGNSDEAPEALFLAADVHGAIGNNDAARRALVELVEQFGGGEDNPWVNRARETLENENNMK